MHIYLRKKHENLVPHELEKEFGHAKIVDSHDCPVCRTRIQLIKGIDVHWKTSVLEPSETLTDVLFETIFNSDGNMTADWEGKQIIDPLQIRDNNDYPKFDPETGELLNLIPLRGGAASQLAIANERMYILSRAGKLIAFQQGFYWLKAHIVSNVFK